MAVQEVEVEGKGFLGFQGARQTLLPFRSNSAKSMTAKIASPCLKESNLSRFLSSHRHGNILHIAVSHLAIVRGELLGVKFCYHRRSEHAIISRHRLADLQSCSGQWQLVGGKRIITWPSIALPYNILSPRGSLLTASTLHGICARLGVIRSLPSGCMCNNPSCSVD